LAHINLSGNKNTKNILHSKCSCPVFHLLTTLLACGKKENSMKKTWSKYFYVAPSVFVVTLPVVTPRPAGIPSSSMQSTT